VLYVCACEVTVRAGVGGGRWWRGVLCCGGGGDGGDDGGYGVESVGAVGAVGGSSRGWSGYVMDRWELDSWESDGGEWTRGTRLMFFTNTSFFYD